MHILTYIVPFYIIMYLLVGASVTITIFLCHVILVPLVFKYSKTFQRGLIFSNFLPVFGDLEDPASCSGLDGARNLSIEFDSKVDNCKIKIGVWHILPKSVTERLRTKLQQTTDKEELSSIFDEELQNSKTPIVLYAHGNSNSRAATHRVMLYKFFQQLDYHTVALDYRGYGDSTPIPPTEDGVVEDLLVVYEWLRSVVDRSTSPPAVFVWGHSLGTGISGHLLGNLPALSAGRARPLPLPQGLILEAPFTTLAEEVEHHFLTKLVAWLPYFHTCFISPFATRRHAFTTSSHLARAPALPVLILHARDDIIVPHCLGEKLYNQLQQARGGAGGAGAAVRLRSFERREALGHKMICVAAGLDSIVGDFIAAYK